MLNRVGFRALDFMSSTAMGVAVRTHLQDPWQRIRLTRAAVPDAHLQFIGTGLRFISWERAHPDVLRLVYDRLVAAGITRSLAIAVGIGLGGSACYDGLPVSRRPHLRVRGVDELLAILTEHCLDREP